MPDDPEGPDVLTTIQAIMNATERIEEREIERLARDHALKISPQDTPETRTKILLEFAKHLRELFVWFGDLKK